MKKIDPDFNEVRGTGRVLFAADRPIKEWWDRDDSIAGKALRKKIGEIEKAVGRRKESLLWQSMKNHKGVSSWGF